MAPHSKRSSASDLVCEANTKHNVWIRRCAAGSAPAVSPIVHARSAQVGIGERESRRGWGQQLVVRGQLHSPMVKLVMRVAHVAPIRARCFNSKRTSFHGALELEHVESVDLRSAIRKADAVLPAFARVRASAATHSSASRGEAGVVCCFDSGCNTSAAVWCVPALRVPLVHSLINHFRQKVRNVWPARWTRHSMTMRMTRYKIKTSARGSRAPADAWPAPACGIKGKLRG